MMIDLSMTQTGESPLKFPTAFPIKVMGLTQDGFAQAAMTGGAAVIVHSITGAIDGKRLSRSIGSGAGGSEDEGENE